MTKIRLLSVTMGWVLSAAWVLADVPSRAHEDLTNNLNGAMDWAKHLKTEAGKGKKADPQHIKDEIQGISDALNSMKAAYSQLATESPGDVQEGHFLALKKHQERVSAFVEDFKQENSRPKPDFSKMKKLAVEMLAELNSAKHQHNLELMEIEHRGSG